MGDIDAMTGARVLVTGGTGFIGRHAVRALRARGAEVHLLSLHPARVPEIGIHVHVCDLHDHRAVTALLSTLKPESLLHLAWDVTPGTYVTSLDNLRWVQSTLALARAFVAFGGRRLVAAGSAAEYDWHAGVCDERTTPLAPASLYAASKVGLWHILERLCAQTGISFAWGRVFFMYGPDEAPERLVPLMVRAAQRGRALALRHPAQVRDYMHVADVGAAFAALLASEVTGAVNLASGSGTSLSVLAGLVGEAMRSVVAVEPGAAVTDPYPVVEARTTRLREEVGFAPRFTLPDGIQDTCAWWAGQDRMTNA